MVAAACRGREGGTALTNIVKQAQARRALVRVGDSSDAVSVEVSDDGIGFVPGQDTAGFGLIGMRERLAVVEGFVAVDSRPGEGTTLRARIALPARQPAGRA